MEKIQFDSGVRTYRVSGGQKLCFNPADPNLYARFQEAEEKLDQMGKALAEETEDVLCMMQRADKELKALLSWVFPGNDFEKILGGIHLLAVTKSGKTVLENFLEALSPVLCEGAESFAQGLAREADAAAASRRQAQC